MNWVYDGTQIFQIDQTENSNHWTEIGNVNRFWDYFGKSLIKQIIKYGHFKQTLKALRYIPSGEKKKHSAQIANHIPGVRWGYFIFQWYVGIYIILSIEKYYL